MFKTPLSIAYQDWALSGELHTLGQGDVCSVYFLSSKILILEFLIKVLNYKPESYK